MYDALFFDPRMLMNIVYSGSIFGDANGHCMGPETSVSDPVKPHLQPINDDSRYDKARNIKQTQDDFCAKASSGQWENLGQFPEDLQWEALVDVLRGKVKVYIDSQRQINMPLVIDIQSHRFKRIAMRHWTSIGSSVYV